MCGKNLMTKLNRTRWNTYNQDSSANSELWDDFDEVLPYYLTSQVVVVAVVVVVVVVEEPLQALKMEKNSPLRSFEESLLFLHIGLKDAESENPGVDARGFSWLALRRKRLKSQIGQSSRKLEVCLWILCNWGPPLLIECFVRCMCSLHCGWRLWSESGQK